MHNWFVVRENIVSDLDELEDMKPSELIDKILSLPEGHKCCLLFEQLFQLTNDVSLQC